MNVTVDLVNASGDTAVPSRRDFQRWSAAALSRLQPDGPDRELSIRLVDEEESALLNETWRRKAGATNILSFPAGDALPADLGLLGDLAICVPVVKREAGEQNKTEQAHWAHLCVHGVLHLNGYDHEAPREAEAMETLEADILAQLGFADPYQ